jgi:hypothetical protein
MRGAFLTCTICPVHTPTGDRKMGIDDRIELQRFVERLEVFVAIHADCTARQVISFLHIALNPGINLTQLSKRTGMAATSATRHCRAFGFEEMGEECLVVSGYTDGRNKALLMTDHGIRLVGVLLRRPQIVSNPKKETT